jgi:hypothetical protein
MADAGGLGSGTAASWKVKRGPARSGLEKEKGEKEKGAQLIEKEKGRKKRRRS